MANVIQQLMVMVGGDTGGIEGALGTADKTLKEFGLSFTSVIEGLSFSALIAGAVEAGKTFEEASIKIQRATGATGEALAGMEENFANLYKTNTQSADAIAGAMSLISQKTNAAGKELEDLTAISLKFAKVTGSDVATSVEQNQNLFAQWGIATAQQAAHMDKLVVVAQATGITAAKLGQTMLALSPTLHLLGFSFDEGAALIGNFSKHGIDAQSVVGALDKAMGSFAKQGITDAKGALEILITKLQDAPDKTTALKIAVDTLGGKAGALVGLVDAARLAAFQTDALVEKQQSATGTVDKLAESTQTLGGMLTKLGHELQDALEPLGKGLITAATDAVTAFAPLLQAVGNVTKAFGELPGYVEASIVALGFFGANPITLGVLALASAVGILASELKGVTDPLHKLDGAFAEYLTKQITGAKSAQDYAKAEDLINKSLDAGAISAKDAEKALTLLKAAQDKSFGAGFSTGITVLKPVTSATPPPAPFAPADKIHWAKDLADDLAVLKAREEQAKAAHKSMIEEIAASGLTIQQFFTKQLYEAVKSETEFTKHAEDFPAVGSTLTALARPIDDINKLVGKLAVGFNDANKEANDSTAYGKLATAFETLHLSVNSLTGDLENKLVGAFKTVAASDLATASQVEESWGAAGNAINKLAKTDLPSAVSAYQAYIDALKRTGAAVGEIYTAQEKLLNLEIEQKQQRGVSSQAEIIQLTNVQMRTQALKTLSEGLGPMYRGLMKDFSNAFTTLGNNVVAGITGAKKWGQVWHDTLKSIETDILTTVIQAFLKLLEAWIITMITKKVTSSSVDLAEVVGQAAIGGAGVAAWTASIPFVGPALAIPAGLAEFASILGTFGPLATFEHGGRVPEDMMAYVHKGEYFLPAHDTAVAAAGGGSGVTIHFHGDFTGVTQDLVNTVMNKAVTAARRAGAKL